MRPEAFNEVHAIIKEIGLGQARQACLKIKTWEIIDKPGRSQETRPVFDDGLIRKILSQHGLMPTRERITAFVILSCVK